MRTVAIALLLACPASAAEFTIDGRAFTLPDGLAIERVAGPPLVDRPIVADFDERGRLYVADSSGSNEPVKIQVEKRPHRIVRLEDVDGDGVFDKRSVFADRMMFPEGAMWLDGSLYVAAPPVIWKLTDLDDDGVADRREAWFDGKTLGGCANDLHGPYRGPDGWIYWCKGGFEPQTFDRPGKGPITSRAAHVFRARPDGSGLEAVMTGGMDNPVDVVFTRSGEPIVSCTFLQHPAEGRRDGLIHVVHGGVYGKVHNVIDGHPRTGPDVMPVLTHLGPAAPCGLARYESVALGWEFYDNLFACQFNMRKVSRHRLIPDGSTFRTEDFDFLNSPDRDFHPTDVVEDADGSLLVVDTGGWYKLCCPTSQLEKPDVLGAIYRIRAVGRLPIEDPRGLRLDWDRPAAALLAARLGDHRPAVRRRAVEALARRGREAMPALRLALKDSDALRNVGMADVFWTSARIDDPEARELIRRHLGEPAAIKAVGLARDREALRYLVPIMRRGATDRWVGPVEPRAAGPDLASRRVAAEALGRIGDKAAVPAILETLAEPTDRALDHALTYALIEIADPIGTAKGLASDKPAVRRAAMVALDQMGGGGLKAEQVAPALSSRDAALRESAAWIVGRHPEWAGPLAETLRDRLRSGALAESDREELARQLARFAKSPAIQALLGAALADPGSTPEARRVALRAMGESGLKAMPGAWVRALGAALDGDDPGLVARAVATLRAPAVPLDGSGELAVRLRGVAGRSTLPVDVRLGALAAATGGPGTLPAGLFDLIRGQLDPARPVADRLLAAEVVARADLTSDQLKMLTDIVATAGPMEVDRLLGAFERTADEAIGLRLLEALGRSSALASLRADTIRPRLAKYGPEVRRRAEALYARLNVDAAGQRARVDELLTTLPPGDVRRGQAVFNGPKAACLSCHAIGYVGGKVGPDLSRVGQVRRPRDLIESIVYPSLSFVRGFEPVVVATTDGRTVSGVVVEDAPDAIVLAVGPDQRERIPRDRVEEVRPGAVSVMPAGLDAQLSRRELADLLAFLASRK